MRALSSSNEALLLKLARESIAAYLHDGTLPVCPSGGPELEQKAGCFVTLRMGGALRGCVGTFSTESPLADNVIRMARAAAFQDTRFAPVGRDEVDRLRIEISVLSPSRRVHDLNEIEIGRHGVIVRLGDRTGTLLPDVATEHKMSREEFLMCCAREKAGLSPEEISRAEIHIYEVQKFGES